MDDLPETRCEIMLDPAEVPPNAVFVLSTEHTLSQRQHALLKAWWDSSPLGEFKCMVLDQGIQMRVLVPVES